MLSHGCECRCSTDLTKSFISAMQTVFLPLASQIVVAYFYLYAHASDQWWWDHTSKWASFDSTVQPNIYQMLESLLTSFSSHLRNDSLNRVREMFEFAYGSYTTYAFPFDELNPINCTGRGYDHKNPDNINVNDALGDYHLTLVDTLDTLAVCASVTAGLTTIR